MNMDMKITIKNELRLRDFEAWGGGASNLKAILNNEECDIILALLTDIINDFNYEDGSVTPTQVNDFLWYDSEITIKDYLGIDLHD